MEKCNIEEDKIQKNTKKYKKKELDKKISKGYNRYSKKE